MVVRRIVPIKYRFAPRQLLSVYSKIAVYSKIGLSLFAAQIEKSK
jgi:hypothetical protein